MKNPAYRFTTFYTVGSVNPTVHSTTCYADSVEAATISTPPLPVTVVGVRLETYDRLTDQYVMCYESGITGDKFIEDAV